MIIDDLDVAGVSVPEAKTQMPLIIYPNVELPLTIALQCLQSVINAPRDVE